MTLMVTLPPRTRLRTRVGIEPAGRMAWTRRGDRLIVSGPAATVIVDGKSGGEVERWPHAYAAFACGWDDAYVAAATTRGYVDLWRFGRARPGEPAARHAGPITAIAFSADDRRIFTAGDDGQVGIWRAATLDAAFHAVGGRVHDLSYDAGDDALAVAAGRAGAVILDATTGAVRAAVRPPDRATAVAWAGETLFVGTRDGQLAAYERTQLEPVRPTGPLGLGAIAQLLPFGDGVVVEGKKGVALLDAASGAERWRWPTGATVPGGALAVHPGQRALAVAVPAGVAILDVEAEPAPARAPAAAPARGELLALYHPGDAAQAQPVLAHLVAAGARLIDGSHDSRRFVDGARRAAVAVVFYGPAGAPPQHDYHLDVLETRGVRVVPVILPGGAVPEAQRRFHGAAYVCFHERVQDADALARVSRAALPGRDQ
jgi:hypothetical protein